jgi:Flp pilus assembly protein TadG
MASEAALLGALRDRLGRSGREQGSATETAIVFLAALTAILLIIQCGLAFHAQHIALAAAEEGARAARLYQATDADGAARARQALAALDGGRILVDPRISVVRSGNDSVEVRVSGGVVSMLPGLTLSIRPQIVRGPVERFRGPGDQ